MFEEGIDLKLIEHICALFPGIDYTFPEGEYRITISNKTHLLACKEVIFLKKNHFEVTEKLKEFYNFLKSNKQYFIQKFPYIEEHGILFLKNYFAVALKDYCQRIDIEKEIKGLIDYYYCLYIVIDHDYKGTRQNAIEYIKKVRGLKEIDSLKQIYFSVVEEFYKYIIILRSPYINITDINYKNIDGMFTYFFWEDLTLITEERVIPFNYYEPTMDHLCKNVQEFFDKNENIPIEDLFMAKAKVYERLHNHSMAIIHTVIALEIVVPKFINEYFKSVGVDSDSILDFDNKFGLSVRVKAILKIILTKGFHEDIKKVGTIIKFRNKIMHEGKTNDFFKNINVEELIVSSELLILELKKRIREFEN